MLSNLACAYQSKYSSDHMILSITEEWKENLERLPRAFDCLPHDPLNAKLNAYGFDRQSLGFFYSYLKRRKQFVNVKNIKSTFQTPFSGGSSRIDPWICAI